MAVYDRWHTKKPGSRKNPTTGELERVEPCREHTQYPSTNHGQGDRWQVRWRDETGKQCKANRLKKAGRDPDQSAEALDAKIRAELDIGTYVDPSAGKITLKVYGEQWLSAQTFDENTHQAVELRLRLHVFEYLGQRELRSLRPSVIQAWVSGLHGKIAPNYVRTVFANLSGLLSAAVDDGLIPKNPCRAGSVKPPAAEKPRIIPWPIQQVTTVRAKLPKRYQALVDLGSGLGMRQGEVFGLAVEDIDFLRAVVHVRRQVKIVRSRLVFGPPKGGKERDVPLPESVALRLAAHIAEFPAFATALPWRHPEGKVVTAKLIFVSRERKALNRNYFNTFLWRPALVAADVELLRVNGFHALRHHFASVLLADGVDIRALAEYLGHSDPGFTLRTYTHLMPSATERMRKAVDRALNGETTDGLPATDVP